MKTAVTLSTFAYSHIVRWYPPALRSEYECDMIALFEEELEAAFGRSSWRGAMKLWAAVAHEITEIALPWHVARASPFLLAIICSIVFFGSMMMAVNPNRFCSK